jgi:hypothetical protein
MNTTFQQDRLAQNSARLSLVIKDVAPVEEQIRRLTLILNGLKAKRALFESLIFIDANKIQKSDVEFSSGGDVPYFGQIDVFAKYLRELKRERKPWAEWNGIIYRTSDLLADAMPYTMPGRTNDL